MKKQHRICRLICLLASQMMASWSCATVIPQDSLAQPALATEHDEPPQIPLLEQDVDADASAEGPDASDATESPHEEPEAADNTQGGAISAADYLSQAFDLFRNAHHDAAIRLFQTAIDTGELNDAGRSLAYWHIAVAQQAMGAHPAAQDALESFVVVSVDLLARHTPPATDERNRNDEGNAVDFVQRFDLVRRVARARAELSVAWAQQTASFGRSAGMPVPIHSVAEMHYFLELAPPCLPGHRRQAYQAPVSMAERQAGVSQIQLCCDDNRVQAAYFFVAVGGN